MTLQTAPISPATAAVTSTAITVAASASVTVGIYSATNGLVPPADVEFQITIATGSAATTVGKLGNNSTAKMTAQLFGPGTFYVTKPETVSAFGVFLDA